MKKQKENVFLDKFSLLNSQEHSEEIHWSSSGSSDYEDMSLNDRSSNQIHRTRVLKRKRKKKVPKNISNLNITILDTSRQAKKVILEEKSPVLERTIIHRRSTSPSPILKPSRSICKGNTVSPILKSKNIHIKSPILIPKTEPPKSAEKVRKKLFSVRNFNENGINSENQTINLKQELFSDISIKKETVNKDNEIIIAQSVEIKEIDDNLTQTENTSNAKLEFVKNVKSFFDSHFSSQNTSPTSQNSICEISTSKSSTKTSEEIEIFTCTTQILPTDNNNAEAKQEISANSSENSVYDFNKHSKKIRYKKNGHAYRLNKLLRKQNASLSLWQHERFLAANSNFVIPKGEFTVFRIQKVNFKYGCHFIECVHASDEKFIILINSCYVSENIVCEMILKLYEPYKIVQYGNWKLIINVTKFECNIITS